MFANADPDDIVIEYQTLGRRLLRSTAEVFLHLGVQADFRKRGHRVSLVWSFYSTQWKPYAVRLTDPGEVAAARAFYETGDRGALMALVDAVLARADRLHPLHRNDLSVKVVPKFVGG